MKTYSTTNKFRNSILIKGMNIMLLALILVSGNSFATSTSVKEGEDSNKVVKHNIPSDDKDAVKISLPNTRTVNRADREIHLNMARLIKEYNNPTLIKPDMQEADQSINNDFFSNYRISISENNMLSDEELTNLFFAYNLMLPSADLYIISDDTINFAFFVENYMSINAHLFVAGDVSMNQKFNQENAE